MGESRLEVRTGCVEKDNTIFENLSKSSTYGGAVAVYGATFSSKGTAYKNNQISNAHGGAISIMSNVLIPPPKYGTALLSNCSFEGNKATKYNDNQGGWGGAIYIGAGNTCTLSNVTFNGNVAERGGGAIYNDGAALTFDGYIDLQTGSDTIVNAGTATMTWDITENSATLKGYDKLTNNNNTLCIKVDNSMAASYTLATQVEDDLAANKQSFKLTGINGESDVLLSIDSPAVQYGNYFYTLTHNTDADTLVMSVSSSKPSGPVYVNSVWTSQDDVPEGFVWGENAFKSFSTAKTVAPEKIYGVTGAGDTQSGVIVLEGIETVLQGAGTYTGVVMGGDRELSGTKTATKNTNLTISAGTYTNNVVGGGYAGNASGVSLTQNGITTLTISGGVFEKAVAGGMYAYNKASVSDDAKVILDAGTASDTAVKFTISGGTFNGRIYGGNYAYDDSATDANSFIDGSVNLRIDASGDNAINIFGGIDAGSRGTGTGMITGDVQVTFTGDGDNLDFGVGHGHPSVFGGCNMDGYKKLDESDKLEVVSGVVGNRILTFDGFKGSVRDDTSGLYLADFDANIRMFDTLEVLNNSQVNLTNGDVDLTDVETWHFDSSSKLLGVDTWDFSGDTLKLDGFVYMQSIMRGSLDGEVQWFDDVVWQGNTYEFDRISGTSAYYSCSGKSDIWITDYEMSGSERWLIVNAGGPE